jgi:phage major head subunit gpT-like protein
MSGLGPTIAQREQIENARVTLHTYFHEELDQQAPDPIEQLALTIDSSTAIEEYDWVGDIPGLTEWVGDREEATIMAGAFTIKNKDWSSGVRIHKNEILDHKMPQVKVKLMGLAQAAGFHYGELLGRLLVNGFDGALTDVGDGKSYDGALFFSTSHSAEGGPTQTNRVASNPVLTESSLELALKMAGRLRNHTGRRPLRVRMTHLVCGPDLEPTADRILGRDFVPEVGSAISVTNIYKGRLQKLVSQELTGAYANYWAVVDLSKPLRPFLLQKREPITSTALTDWSTELMYRRGEQRFGAQSRDNAGYGSWQLAVGSTGAGS